MIAKYLFDRIMAFVGLIVLSPVLLVVWMLIRVKMPDGPAVFTQKRVGKDGKQFTMYKFRSMSAHHSGSTVSVAGESRITPLGAKLRRYKLDELPELWNVLIGDMSFVGPRPDVPGYADKLEGDDRRVLQLRPGITGPASLKYRDEEVLLAGQANPQEFNDKQIIGVLDIDSTVFGRFTDEDEQGLRQLVAQLEKVLATTDYKKFFASVAG